MDQSSSVWYFPLVSRLDLYRTSMDLLRQPLSNITEEELINSACTTVAWEGFTPVISGYSSHSMQYEFEASPDEDNTFSFKGDWREGT